MTFEQRMIPIWDTDTIWGESLCMVQDASGSTRAPLLVLPRKILSVSNAAEDTFYEENRDWYLDDGWFCLTPDSRIFSFSQKELYPDEAVPGHSFPTADGYLRFEEGHFFHDRQIAVSYTCERGIWQGVRPAYAGDKLPNTIAKLQSRQPLRVLVFGDSISEGANASGMTGAAPHQPAYFQLFCQELSRRTGCQVTFENVSKGGMDSTWGAENLDRLVTYRDFDLLFVAFGMNDGGKAPEDFSVNIHRIVKGVVEKKPESEILLIATSTPNPVLTSPGALFFGNQPLFKSELDRIEMKFSSKIGIAIADITGMQAFLHSRKRFIDTTGNHVNHPNDFFHRCYAQFLTGMLL